MRQAFLVSGCLYGTQTCFIRTLANELGPLPEPLRRKEKSRTPLQVSGLYLVPPPGIEPGSQPSEGRILSVEIQRGSGLRRGRKPNIIAYQPPVCSDFPKPR